MKPALFTCALVIVAAVVAQVAAPLDVELSHSLLAVGRLHALAVHAPIGALLLVAVLEVLHALSPRAAPSLALPPRAVGFVALFVCATYATGFLLGHEDTYAVGKVTLHERWAFAVVVATLGMWLASLARRETAFRASVLACLFAVTVTGHLGGTLTHGSTWLTEHLAPTPAPSPPSERVDAGNASAPTADAPKPSLDAGVVEADGGVAVAVPSPANHAQVSSRAPEPRKHPPTREAHAAPSEHVVEAGIAHARAQERPPPLAAAVDAGLQLAVLADAGATDAPPPSVTSATEETNAWRGVVRPIFEARCVGCHSGRKAKGKLHLDSLGGVRAGGEDGAVVKAGDAASSMMTKRLHLPRDDDDHMPPARKPQLTAAEIEVLTAWINAGANDSTALEQLHVSATAVEQATTAAAAAAAANAAAEATKKRP